MPFRGTNRVTFAVGVQESFTGGLNNYTESFARCSKSVATRMYGVGGRA